MTSTKINWDTPKLREAEQSLLPGLRSQFRSLVESLVFHTAKRGWTPIRQYSVIADLVREGWRGPACSEANSPQGQADGEPERTKTGGDS